MNYLLTANLSVLPTDDFVKSMRTSLDVRMPEGTKYDLDVRTMLDGGVECRIWLKLPDSLSEGDPNKVQDAIHTVKLLIGELFDPHCTVNVKFHGEDRVEPESSSTETENS